MCPFLSFHVFRSVRSDRKCKVWFEHVDLAARPLLTWRWLVGVERADLHESFICHFHSNWQQAFETSLSTCSEKRFFSRNCSLYLRPKTLYDGIFETKLWVFFFSSFYSFWELLKKFTPMRSPSSNPFGPTKKSLSEITKHFSLNFAWFVLRTALFCPFIR